MVIKNKTKPKELLAISRGYHDPFQHQRVCESGWEFIAVIMYGTSSFYRF